MASPRHASYCAGIVLTLLLSGAARAQLGACCYEDLCVEVAEALSCTAYVCDVSTLLPATFSGCYGDVDGNGVVNAGDRGFIAAGIGRTEDDPVCLYDLDGNGVINAADRGVVSASAGLCLPLPDYQNGSGHHGGSADFRFPAKSFQPGLDCEHSGCGTPMGMVFVPRGAFEMGDPWNEGLSRERPVHTVYTGPFFIDRYEVTNAQYVAALNWARTQGGLIGVTGTVVYRAGGSSHPYCGTTAGLPGSRITWNGSTFGVVAGKEDHPVVGVSWYGAAAFCNWRSAMEGRTPCFDTSTWACNFAADGFRLPTEAEWEKAAAWDPVQQRHYRFGTGSDGGGVSTLEGLRANYWPSGDPFEVGAFPWTTPVGYYNGTTHGSYETLDAKSYYGCYDMSGNVWEWCSDWYLNGYYSGSPAINPRGPDSGTHRVFRGGGWEATPTNVRAANRGFNLPASFYDDVGFRCAAGS